MALTAFAASAPAAARPAAQPALVTDPASLVNPFIGTGPDVSASGGGGPNNTFPGPDVPFGMIQWGPDTSPDRQRGGGYYYGDSQIQGFSLTHLDGPGCHAFGDVPILPTVGTLPASPGSATEPFSHASESASADYYSVQTGSPAIKTELTAAAHSAIGRFTFPATTRANLLFKLSDSQNGDLATSAQVVGHNEVQGSVTSGHFCGGPTSTPSTSTSPLTHPFTGYGTWTGPRSRPAPRGTPRARPPPAGTSAPWAPHRCPAPPARAAGFAGGWRKAGCT